jgi:hypothetical protein
MRTRLGRRSHKGELSIGILPSGRASPWQETGDPSHRSQVTGDYLPCLKNVEALPRAGKDLF